MDLKAEGWVQWGNRRESSARVDPRQPKMIEITGDHNEAPNGVLHWPDVWMLRLTKPQAKKLGAALIRLSNAK